MDVNRAEAAAPRLPRRRSTGCGRAGCSHAYDIHEDTGESKRPCFYISWDDEECDCPDWQEPGT